ncbi:MAG TPA: M20 family metallopeptidase [Candidatus Acidoferrales bacterium]|nr:M20 family metallopeptidase [Candidatus Acidoferrales bacterium]
MPRTVTEHHDTLRRARALQPKLVKLRRQIHAHPELSFKERDTARLITNTLFELGYEVRLGVGGTGVIGEIGEGRTIVVRADMDALPINEANDCAYASRNEGVMHACGHDVHVTCALGAAMLIAETAPKNGRVRFLFQPAEETVNEDGKSGAVLVMESGATHEAEAVIALHVDPRLPVGKIAVREGAVLAACDSIDITVRGVGSHGAFPELGVDAVVLASNVVQSLQTVVSRRKSALSPVVLTIGGIKSNTFRPNILAEEVELTGTLRYFDAYLSEVLPAEVRKACSVAEALGGSHQLRYNQDNPALVNDPQLTNLIRFVGKQILGQANVLEGTREMGAEDFSFYSRVLPSCFFFLGSAIKGSPRKLHTPTFDIDEAAQPIGAAMLAEAALHYLTPEATY